MILTAALIIFDLLLVWALTLTRRVHWSPLVAIAIMTTLLNIMVINAFSTGSGWPKRGFPNSQVLFIDCDVIAPSGTFPGAIYILVQPPSQNPTIGFHSDFNSPRLFQESYSLRLEKQCQQAKRTGQQGVPVAVKRSQHGVKGKGKGSAQGAFVFYSLPPSSVGPKP